MRTIIEGDEAPSDRELAEKARELADSGIDSYSGYGVGAVLVTRLTTSTEPMEIYNTYGGMNINLSGMEVKIHAEQLALFQALTDMRVSDLNDVLRENTDIFRIVVATSEDDLALDCGHCTQVIYGACEYLGTDPAEVGYSAVKAQQTMTEYGPDGVIWTWDRHTLKELKQTSYTEKR